MKNEDKINKRAVVVVDRGWIFAGDVSKTSDGYIRLDHCVWVFCWKSVGFAAVIEDPSKADIRKIKSVEIPPDAIVFRVPVRDNWGYRDE